MLDDSPSFSFRTSLFLPEPRGVVTAYLFLESSYWSNAFNCCYIKAICIWMFLLIVFLLDGVKLRVWLTVFMFGVFSSGNGTKGRDLPGWCIDLVKDKLVPGVVVGGQCMPREFCDETPACCVLKVTNAGRLTRASVVPDGLMGGWMGGTDVPMACSECP